MLDNILEVIKEQVVPVITGNTEIPDDKKSSTIDTTASSVLDGLKSQLIPSNLSEVGNMFSGESPVNNFGNNEMVQKIQSTVSSALVSKVGLSSSIATTIATSVVPLVLNLFTNKDNEAGKSGLDIQSLIKALTAGKDSSDSGSGSLLDKIGGLF